MKKFLILQSLSAAPMGIYISNSIDLSVMESDVELVHIEVPMDFDLDLYVIVADGSSFVCIER